MFAIGILIGIYAYTIFSLGLLGILYSPVVILWTIVFVGVVAGYYRKNIRKILELREVWKKAKNDRISLLLLFLLFLQLVINFIGALGPELGFDATWYHLTLPKIYFIQHAIPFIPGGLLYYSAMPKLLELLYVGGLAIGSTVPKLIHFGFGVLTLFALYAISRKFLSRRISFLVLIVFYTNLVVGWESISAYIDLGRTFFELLSVWAFVEWRHSHAKKYFYYSALFMGFAITTKLLALGSLGIMLVLIALAMYQKATLGALCTKLVSYVVVALVVPSPWLVFAFIHNGNPVYPFFSQTYPVSFPIQLMNPLYFVSSFWNLLLYAADPLSPLYLMALPLPFIFFRKWPKSLQLIFLYTVGGLLFWYITPRTGGGRFILPYLPLLSLIIVAAIMSLSQKLLKQFLFCVILCLAFLSIGYRAIANAKFVPVLIGKESEAQFLTQHLNFSFGDFYDIDGYFAKHIKPTDTVLLYGFHNEYYVDFPFIDATWVQKGDSFDYVAVQNSGLPKSFQTWKLVYTNKITHVALYSAGGIPWIY